MAIKIILTIYIDIDVELSINRRKDDLDDRMEEGGLKFLTNVKKGYDELALLYPDLHQLNITAQEREYTVQLNIQLYLSTYDLKK